MNFNVKNLIFQKLISPKFGKIIYNIFGENVYTIPIGNFIFKCPPNIISYQNRARIFWGYYERAKIKLINKYLKKDFDIIELGTSIGIVSTYAHKFINDNKHFLIDANPHLIYKYANVFVFDKIENETK